MGKDTPTTLGGRGGLPAALVDAGVSQGPDSASERGRRCLRHRTRSVRGCAAQPFQLQEAIRQEAHGRVMVKAGPRASFEVVQTQFFFELLIALLDVPTT